MRRVFLAALAATLAAGHVLTVRNRSGGPVSVLVLKPGAQRPPARTTLEHERDRELPEGARYFEDEFGVVASRSAAVAGGVKSAGAGGGGASTWFGLEGEEQMEMAAAVEDVLRRGVTMLSHHHQQVRVGSSRTKDRMGRRNAHPLLLLLLLLLLPFS